MTFREKCKALIDAGFEFGAHSSFLLGPSESSAGRSQRIFNPPEREQLDDAWSDFDDEPIFTSIEDMEAVIDKAIEYGRSRGLISTD